MYYEDGTTQPKRKNKMSSKLRSTTRALLCCLLVYVFVDIEVVTSMSLERLKTNELTSAEALSASGTANGQFVVDDMELAAVPAMGGNTDMYMLVPAGLTGDSESVDKNLIESAPAEQADAAESDMLMMESNDEPVQVEVVPAPANDMPLAEQLQVAEEIAEALNDAEQSAEAMPAAEAAQVQEPVPAEAMTVAELEPATLVLTEPQASLEPAAESLNVETEKVNEEVANDDEAAAVVDSNDDEALPMPEALTMEQGSDNVDEVSNADAVAEALPVLPALTLENSAVQEEAVVAHDDETETLPMAEALASESNSNNEESAATVADSPAEELSVPAAETMEQSSDNVEEVANDDAAAAETLSVLPALTLENSGIKEEATADAESANEEAAPESTPLEQSTDNDVVANDDTVADAVAENLPAAEALTMENTSVNEETAEAAAAEALPVPEALVMENSSINEEAVDAAADDAAAAEKLQLDENQSVSDIIANAIDTIEQQIQAEELNDDQPQQQNDKISLQLFDLPTESEENETDKQAAEAEQTAHDDEALTSNTLGEFVAAAEENFINALDNALPEETAEKLELEEAQEQEQQVTQNDEVVEAVNAEENAKETEVSPAAESQSAEEAKEPVAEAEEVQQQADEEEMPAVEAAVAETEPEVAADINTDAGEEAEVAAPPAVTAEEVQKDEELVAPAVDTEAVLDDETAAPVVPDTEMAVENLAASETANESEANNEPEVAADEEQEPAQHDELPTIEQQEVAAPAAEITQENVEPLEEQKNEEAAAELAEQTGEQLTAAEEEQTAAEPAQELQDGVVPEAVVAETQTNDEAEEANEMAAVVAETQTNEEAEEASVVSEAVVAETEANEETEEVSEVAESTADVAAAEETAMQDESVPEPNATPAEVATENAEEQAAAAEEQPVAEDAQPLAEEANLESEEEQQQNEDTQPETVEQQEEEKVQEIITPEETVEAVESELPAAEATDTQASAELLQNEIIAAVEEAIEAVKEEAPEAEAELTNDEELIKNDEVPVESGSNVASEPEAAQEAEQTEPEATATNAEEEQQQPMQQQDELTAAEGETVVENEEVAAETAEQQQQPAAAAEAIILMDDTPVEEEAVAQQQPALANEPTTTTTMLTTIVQMPTTLQLATQAQQQLTEVPSMPAMAIRDENVLATQPQQQLTEQQLQQNAAAAQAIESSTTNSNNNVQLPLNVADSVLNYVNASFIKQQEQHVQQQVQQAINNNISNNNNNNNKDSISAHLRRYDGAQVWRIVVQNDRDKKLADELQTKYDGQLWKEVKQEVDYLLKPQVLAAAEQHVRASNLSRIVLIDNLQHVIEVENPTPDEIAQLQNRKGHRLTWQAYHRLEDIHGFFDYLAKTYPDICSVETIGYSIEKRPLKILKVSNGNATNPGVWIDGGMHAREWISPATVTFIANQIVEGWDDLPEYMRNINWYIHAVANPDGYEYSHTTDRLWRKNMRSHGRQCPGVDLNRNFGYKWGGKGTSANPCAQTYRGSKAFSEPETFYISKFISNFPRGTFQAYLSFHSYGQYILYPWGYDYLVAQDNNDLDRIARQAGSIITKSTGTKYTVGSSATTLYPAAGGSDDWAKGIAGIKYAYTIEMGDTGRFGFVLPASYIQYNGKDGYTFVETVARAIVMQGKEKRRRRRS